MWVPGTGLYGCYSGKLVLASCCLPHVLVTVGTGILHWQDALQVTEPALLDYSTKTWPSEFIQFPLVVVIMCRNHRVFMPLSADAVVVMF